MIQLFSRQQLDDAKFKDPLPLECMWCHSTFYKTKKRILQNCISTASTAGGFCSAKCWTEYSHEHSTISIKCAECGKEKIIYKKEVKPKNFCSQSCSAVYYNRPRKRVKIKFVRVPTPPTIVKCKYCGNDTTNTKYCNGTCRNKDQNRFKNGSKSYAEKVLVSKLKSNFPQWTIVENDRKILDGLELDIYIPEIKLAIEWNGVYHLLPIKGNDALQKILQKDYTKVEKCKLLGINLIVVSDRTSHKKFVEETTNDLVVKLKKWQAVGDSNPYPVAGFGDLPTPKSPA